MSIPRNTFLFVVLSALSAFAATASKPTPTTKAPSAVALPQTKCEDGFLSVQFQGVPGWFGTNRVCDPTVVAGPSRPRLDTAAAGGNLSRAQLDALLDAYLAGQSQTSAREVCCCQPGWRVYDTATTWCSGGVLRSKGVFKE